MLTSLDINTHEIQAFNLGELCRNLREFRVLYRDIVNNDKVFTLFTQLAFLNKVQELIYEAYSKFEYRHCMAHIIEMHEQRRTL